MVISSFAEKTEWIWKDGELVPWELAQIHVGSGTVGTVTKILQRTYMDIVLGERPDPNLVLQLTGEPVV